MSEFLRGRAEERADVVRILQRVMAASKRKKEREFLLALIAAIESGEHVPVAASLGERLAEGVVGTLLKRIGG